MFKLDVEEYGERVQVSAINFGLDPLHLTPAIERQQRGRLWVRFGIRTVIDPLGHVINREFIGDENSQP
jgi:hypothetical protein